MLSWLAAVLIEYLLLPAPLRDLSDLHGLARMSLFRVTAITCGGAALLTALSRSARARALERWCTAALFALLSVLSLCASFTWPYFALCALITAVLAVYGARGYDARPERAPGPAEGGDACLYVTAAASALFFLLVAAWTAGRVYSFCSPTYDFGIFSQMFHSMKTTGLPTTTLERDGALSHFAVHVSPIYYCALPIYCLFPSPVTLQLIQAAVITSAVIPLWKIGRLHALTGAQRAMLCAALLLYPAFSGGVGYDIHENCFLTPLLLWLFYGIDRKNAAVTAVAAALTLSVKEDAAVYVAVIGLYLTVRGLVRSGRPDRRDLITGSALLAVSVGWFLLVTGYLSRSGDGVMTYRYENLMYDGSGSLITVVKSVILNPMKALFECVDAEKLRYILLTMAPLLGLPLLTRRYERYLMLIPYLLVNLMSDYTYQHDLFFQYSFGSTAFLLYLTAVNLADMRGRRTFALAGAVAVSAICFSLVVVPVAVRYPARAIRFGDYYQDIRDALDAVPEDASVCSTTFYTARLSARETLYDVRYCSREHLLESEYVVLSLSGGDYGRYASPGAEDGFDNLVRLLENNGYREFLSLEGVLVIYRR